MKKITIESWERRNAVAKWVDLPQSPDRYEIFRHGQVRHKRTKHITLPVKRGNKYWSHLTIHNKSVSLDLGNILRSQYGQDAELAIYQKNAWYYLLSHPDYLLSCTCRLYSLKLDRVLKRSASVGSTNRLYHRIFGPDPLGLEWAAIHDWSSETTQYRISRCGKVQNIETGRMMTVYHSNGYDMVGLRGADGRHNYFLRVLLKQEFDIDYEERPGVFDAESVVSSGPAHLYYL